MPEKHAASDPIADRLLEILQREYERCGSSFLELQEEIKRANGDDRWIERRKLSTILNALLDAGLEPERFIEPPALVPTLLLWRCRRR